MPPWFNLPNALTSLRLLLTPAVIEAIVAGRSTLALVLFAAAAVTDVLDGAAARRLGLSTKTGAYLDPVADKCLLSGVFLALALADLVPHWFVAIVFGRDLYLLCASALMLRLTPVRSFPPSVWGKASTFLQICTATVWMARNMLEISLVNAVAAAMLWPCAAFTVWSGLHYTWRGVQVARAH